MDGKLRLLIADDQLLMAQCLQHLLESKFPGVEVVENRQDLVDAAARFTPDLILLDLVMPLTNGTGLVRHIRTVSPATKLVIVTAHGEPEYPVEAFRAGAVGYLLKCCSVSELITAIWQVLDGRSYLTPLVGRVVSAAMNSQPRQATRSLTSRQQQVLQLVAQGRTAKEIASALNFSVKTAVFHKTAIMDRLGLRTTAELTRYALECGIVPVTSKPAPLPLPQAAGSLPAANARWPSQVNRSLSEQAL